MANFVVNLTDGDGFLWDINHHGFIFDGTNDAFDSAFQLNDFSGTSINTAETMNGRQHEIQGTHISGLDVSRLIYVPDDQGHARFFTTFTNNTGAPITFDLAYDNNSGADGSYAVLATSSGDTVQAANDSYIISDDSPYGDGGLDPVVGIFYGDGTLLPTTVGPSEYFIGGTNGSRITYVSVTVQPGESISHLMFAQQNANGADGVADIESFIVPTAELLEGLTQAQLDEVINYSGLRTDHTGDEVLVDMSAATGDFDVRFDTNTMFASFDSATGTSYSWLTPAGHLITAFGTGFAIDGSQLPSSGQVLRIVIDINNDGNDDIVISGLDFGIATLPFATPGAFTEAFWRTVLTGETRVIGGEDFLGRLLHGR